MRPEHFEALKPVCPRCRRDRALDSPLAIASILRETHTGIADGILHCTAPECRLEYPIVDGTPLLVPDIRSYVTENQPHLFARHDLPDAVESLLGDCIGPSTHHDATRQHLSTYAWDQWGDLDPEEVARPEAPQPGAAVRCLGRGLQLLGGDPEGPVLGIGCAVGRTSFELADRAGGLVLGIDLNFSMLGVARHVLEESVVRYPRRRVGIVYDRREFAAAMPSASRVDFWICDALALPFSSGTFGLVSALNVIDCARSPRELLVGIGEVLRPGASAILSTPYDWSNGVTPIEAWIGGHSQRGEEHGASEPFLKALLTPDAHPQSVAGLELTGEELHVPWHARLHDRSTVHYDVHLVVAQAKKH